MVNYCMLTSCLKSPYLYVSNMLIDGVFPELKIYEKCKYCDLMAQSKHYLKESRWSDTVLIIIMIINRKKK